MARKSTLGLGSTKTNRISGHLLVVDDEEITRRSLADILKLEGYQVETANGGRTAIQMISQHDFDLILLDLKMPDVDGLQVMRYVTRDSPKDQPEIIMLTAHGSLESAIEALRKDVHDYLLKPCSPEALLQSVAKGLQKRMKRVEGRVAGVRTGTSKNYQLPHNIHIDLSRREVHSPDQTIRFTPTEGKLMQVLLANPGRVFGHRELVKLVQGYDTKDWEAPEVLRPLVSRLRRKLSKLPDGNDWIRSVRGTGYVLDIEGYENDD